MSSRWILPAAATLATRPDLWRTALRLGRRHVPDRWWAAAPFVPIPDARWMRFRYQTALAASDARPEPEQVIEYLEWAKAWEYLS